MTKELEALLNELNIQNYNLYSALFDELTSNNVCIPKGTEVKVSIWNNGYAVCKVENLVIKPSEPVYEWQYKYQRVSDALWEYTKPMTDDEFNEYEYPVGFEPIKDENTKRVRQ